VKAFLDTSVLVATFYDGHEHHKASFELFVNQEKERGCAAAHTLAEVYSVLTGMPGKGRASGDEALLFLGNIRDRPTIVSLDPENISGSLKALPPRVSVAAESTTRSWTLRAQGKGGEHLHVEHQALRALRRGHCRPRENSVEREKVFAPFPLH